MKRLTVGIVSMVLVSCSSMEPKPMEPSSGHLRPQPEPVSESIPAPVSQMPILPAPVPAPPVETYTVVVNEVPVKDLLFALARDAKMNIDISPGIQGYVTLNAIDQTLPQILKRLQNQINMRYEIEEGVLTVMPDLPYFRTYKVNYLSLNRETKNEISVSANLSSQQDSDSKDKSKTEVKTESSNQLWESIVANLLSILGVDATKEFFALEQTRVIINSDGNVIDTASGKSQQPGFLAFSSKQVMANREAGIIQVLATEGQHAIIQAYLDQVMANVRRQVMIEATIVEVELSDQYQAGVNWAEIATGSGISLLSGVATTAAGATGAASGLLTNIFLGSADTPSFILDYQRDDVRTDGLSLTLNLLKEFGNIKVLSSPKLMALNNQTAILKVVENVVYFTVDVETDQTDNVLTRTFETEIHTVPEGIVMSVTPQIDENGVVVLNVRPTITRISSFVSDPNPDLGATPNRIPQVQIREMESILRINSGQIAVLGGLMQDEDTRGDSGVPGLSDLDVIGNAFKTTRSTVRKTELVVFLRPIVIEEPNIETELKGFLPYLHRAMKAEPVSTAAEMSP